MLNHAPTRQLLDELESCLDKKDWKALRKLHWSDSELTSESLKQGYEPELERIEGKITSRYITYQEVNSSNIEQAGGMEEVPGPVELLSGEIELDLIGSENNNESDAIKVWAYLCEEEGKTKIFGYIILD